MVNRYYVQFSAGLGELAVGALLLLAAARRGPLAALTKSPH
jgi:hypothetical protein